MFLSCLKFLLLILLFGVSSFSLGLNILYIFSQFVQNLDLDLNLLLTSMILNLICNAIILLGVMVYVLFDGNNEPYIDWDSFHE